MQIQNIQSNNYSRLAFGTKLPKMRKDFIIEEHFVSGDVWDAFAGDCIRFGKQDKLKELLDKLKNNGRNDVLCLECLTPNQPPKQGFRPYKEYPEQVVYFTFQNSGDDLKGIKKIPSNAHVCARHTSNSYYSIKPSGFSRETFDKIMEKLERIIEESLKFSIARYRE